MFSEYFFKVTLEIIFCIVSLIRIYFRFRFYHSTKKVSASHKLRELFLAGFTGISLILPIILYLFTNTIQFADFSIHLILRLIGTIMLVLNTILLAWVHYFLGKNWSPILEIHKEQTLIISGPYKWIRHPMYTCLFVYAIALPLHSANYLTGVIPMLSFLGIYFIRIPSEEKMMLQLFGDQYRTYLHKTKRVIPFIF